MKQKERKKMIQLNEMRLIFVNMSTEMEYKYKLCNKCVFLFQIQYFSSLFSQKNSLMHEQPPP